MTRIVYAISAVIVLLVTNSNGRADPISDALDITRTKNPLATIFKQNHRCTLIAPPSPQFISPTKVGAGAIGNVTFPAVQADGVTIDLSSAGGLCPVQRYLPERMTSQLSSVMTSISFKNDIRASLKLTLGSWLKVFDFNATDFEDVGIYINSTEDIWGEPGLNLSAQDIYKSYGNACSAWKPNKINSAKIIERSCIGHIAVSLDAKRELKLNAFDLQFAKLAVGLNASWLREVRGTAKDCSIPGMDSPPATPGTGGAGAASGGAAANKNGVASNVQTTQGSVKITPNSLEAAFSDTYAPSSNTVSKPTAAQAGSVPPAPEEKKPEQPAAQEKICAKNVIYRTGDLQVIGVNAIPAKRFFEWAFAN